MTLSAGFKQTMDAAIGNPKSADFDQLIKDTLADYKTRLGSTPGFPAVDWKLFKALLLVESGGPAGTVWAGKVMQIGNTGDPAIGVLRHGTEHSKLVMNATLVADLKKDHTASTPNLNIRAAMAYMFTRAVQAKSVVKIDNPAILSHTVTKNESLAVIALKENTTIENLAKNNPTKTGTIHPGDKLQFQRSHKGEEISGWLTIDADFLADRYNGGGDPNYAEKLNYVLGKL